MTDGAMETGPFFIGTAEPSSEANAEIIGSKAALLAEMARLGLTVPPAFVLPTRLCDGVNRQEDAAERALKEGLRAGIAWLENATGRRFGDSRKPLFVSVRSGAAKSMPGMLDTVLNVGMTSGAVQGLVRMTGNPLLAWDSCRRFVQSFAEAVYAVPTGEFETCLAGMLETEGVASEAEIDCEAMERLYRQFIDVVTESCGRRPPEDPMDQLEAATRAVYASWRSPRACEYRRINGLDDLLGTAVTVQSMVFGNSGGRSGAGVAFSRNPGTGANELYVDFLFNAQGEDIVSGRRIPGDLSVFCKWLPDAAQQLTAAARRLEAHFKDVQDMEFTVEQGRLYFLQTRAAKRTPSAALRIAVDMAREGLITPKEAQERLAHVDLNRARRMKFKGAPAPLAKAAPASPGVASGRIALDSESAKRLAAEAGSVILVRREPSTEDIVGFDAAAGILTMVGGRTAHAAVVARQLGKVCLVGCRALEIDERARQITLAGRAFKEGDWLSMDGESGEIFPGAVEIVAERPEAELAALESLRAEAGGG